MEIIEQTIEIKKTGRYYMLGKSSNNIKHLVIAFHGYGQLGKYFVKNFEHLDLSRTLILVPEGLSKFYLNGTNGRVGASWMTKEDRLNEIEDQKNYLDTVMLTVLSKLNKNINVQVLGFSQGTATACRWISRNANFPISNLILWAGSIPDECIKDLMDVDIHYVLGDQDQYITTKIAEQKIQGYKNKGLRITLNSFSGKHHLDRTVLKNLIFPFK